MLKRLFYFIAIAVAVLLVLYWVYFPSISRYRELKLEEEKLTKRIEEIDAQIKSLSTERNLLQTDVAYLEKVIREELGFVKPGEIVYELITKKSPSGPAPAAGESSAGTEVKGITAPEPTASGKTQSTVTPAKKKIDPKSN